MKMINMPVCDLRTIKTAEAAKEIEIIMNTALVIMPKDADDELLTALSLIPKENVATVVELETDTKIQMQNGAVQVTPGMLSDDKDAILLVNGEIAIDPIPAEKKGTLMANGLVLMHEANRKECGLALGMINGQVAYADFDQTILEGDAFFLDEEFLKYAKPKTAIVAGDSIEIADGITSDMLAEKVAHLLAGDSIICPQAAVGFVRVNSTCGDGIEVK